VVPKLKDLRHLDLSGNSFLFIECQELAKALKRNHEIYGFHFDGNFGHTDKKMFLVCPKEETQQKLGEIHYAQQIDSVNCLMKNKES
jgi:hypothetical protein